MFVEGPQPQVPKRSTYYLGKNRTHQLLAEKTEQGDAAILALKGR